jgi:lactoylglutathione lyase
MRSIIEALDRLSSRQGSTDESRIAGRSNSQKHADDEVGREMAEWEKQISAMTLVVGDLERSKTFYREVFGLPPLDEEEDLAILGFKNMYVALRRDPAHQPPGREVIVLAEKGVGQFSIWVEDVDAVRAELGEHGVTVISGPADREWGMRTITFADPDGYIWQISQDLPSAPG